MVSYLHISAVVNFAAPFFFFFLAEGDMRCCRSATDLLPLLHCLPVHPPPPPPPAPSPTSCKCTAQPKHFELVLSATRCELILCNSKLRAGWQKAEIPFFVSNLIPFALLEATTCTTAKGFGEKLRSVQKRDQFWFLDSRCWVPNVWCIVESFQAEPLSRVKEPVWVTLSSWWLWTAPDPS